VLLLEALTYPGGCASTFTHHGWRFETGATLFAGFGEGQLMRRWIDEHRLPVAVDTLDPAIRFRMPGVALDVGADRGAVLAQLSALPGAPRAGLRGFFAEQEAVADALWPLFAEPALLPPFTARALSRHLARAGAYLPLVRLVGRPVLDVLRRHGVADFLPLRIWLDALCQITVQTGVAEAEAPFALAAADYCFRGAGHVHGGIGRLAQAVADAVAAGGGTVRFACRAARAEAIPGGWRVHTREGAVTAANVVCNLLPQGVQGLVDGATPRLDTLAARVETGWGAAMLYLGLRPGADLPAPPHHVEIVVDPAEPLVEGNHLFVSVSGADEADRGPEPGCRSVTVSTHVAAAPLRALLPAERAARLTAVQARMRAGIAAFLPELHAAVAYEATASPRTWARFTRRAEGLVGGVPRRAGLHNYRDLTPEPVRPGLWMVGDSVFPGQSTLAVALGGVKVAERIAG
jgi:phytoene dehydrogenase-like protein